MDSILHFTAEKENSICFNFLEEKIREESRKFIESICKDEVQQFLNRMASIVDQKGKKLVVRNGYHKEQTIQTACGNVELKLPRIDDRKATESFVSKILPPFVRKTPTVETLIASLYLAGVSSNKFREALSSVFGEDSKGFSPNTARVRCSLKVLQSGFELKINKAFRFRNYFHLILNKPR